MKFLSEVFAQVSSLRALHSTSRSTQSEEKVRLHRKCQLRDKRYQSFPSPRETRGSTFISHFWELSSKLFI